MMPNETKRTFTQEQANAMYAFIDTYIFTEMKMYHATRLFVDDMPDWEVGYGIPAGAIMNLRADLYTVDMQAIASQPAAPAPQAGRYTVRPLLGYGVERLAAWRVYDRVAKKPTGKQYDTEAEANAAARDLNASEQGGDNS